MGENESVKPGKRHRRGVKAEEKPQLDGDEVEPVVEEEDRKPSKRACKAKDEADVKPKLEDLEPDKTGRRVKSEPLPGDTEPSTPPIVKPTQTAKPSTSSRRHAGRWSPEDRTALFWAAIKANCGHSKVRTERFGAGVAGRNAKQCLDAWQKTAEPFITKYLAEDPKPVPKNYMAKPTGRKGWDGAALQELFLADVGKETPRFTEGINGRSKNTTRDTWT